MEGNAAGDHCYTLTVRAGVECVGLDPKSDLPDEKSTAVPPDSATDSPRLWTGGDAASWSMRGYGSWVLLRVAGRFRRC